MRSSNLVRNTGQKVIVAELKAMCSGWAVLVNIHARSVNINSRLYID